MSRLILSTLTVLLAFSTASAQKSVRLATDDADYEKIGIKRDSIEVWEDGMRTGDGSKSYEWWYFDSRLEDGSTIVVVFFTKNMIRPNSKLAPFAMVNLDLADGRKITRIVKVNANDFSASDKTCDVRIGDCSFKGDLKNYQIHFEDEVLNLDIDIKRETESWRPETGHSYYGDKDYFAWFVAVPVGTATVNYTLKGQKVSTKGSCYHDHNWGNKPLPSLIHHWYWARAEIGPYSFISSEMIAEEQYGSYSTMVFFLARNGKTEADNAKNIRLLRSYPKVQPTTKKPLSEELVFVYEGEDEKRSYIITLKRERNIANHFLVRQSFKRKLAKLLKGFDGAYYRMIGSANLKIYEAGQLIEEYTNTEAVWELMFFGKS